MASKGAAPLRIVNLIATTDLGTQVDLATLNDRLSHSEYRPEVYFALIYRLTEPHLSILLNRSGKIVFSGAGSLSACRRGLVILTRELRHLGIRTRKNPIEVQNLVLTTRAGFRINLVKLAGEWADAGLSYEPEVFPGVIITPPKTRVALTVYASGAIVVLGVRSTVEGRRVLSKSLTLLPGAAVEAIAAGTATRPARP